MEFSIEQPDISRNLFYITHVNNIQSIIERGILSHESIEQESLPYTPIYDHSIVSNRKEKVVHGKSLWFFTNLYFQPRNPMLYRVLAEKSANDIAIVAVRSDILKNQDAIITDGNAANNNTKFHSVSEIGLLSPQIERIRKMDWWSEFDGTKRAIMAECLIPKIIPSSYIEAIYVSNHSVAEKVRSLLKSDTNIIPEPRIFFQPIKKIDLTPKLSLVAGDLFFSRLQTLTVSVNCVGIMGKGLASRAKYQFPDVYVAYEDHCRRKKLRMGTPVLYHREGSYDQQLADEPKLMKSSNHDTWFLLFPTKQHWRDKSDIVGIEKGLRWLVDNYKTLKMQSLAIPALGCGLGRLEWKDVGPILCRYLSTMDIQVWIYLPAEKDIPNEFLTKEYLLSDSSKS